MKTMITPTRNPSGPMWAGTKPSTQRMVATLLVGLAMIACTLSARAGASNVLPSNATPLGYSLDDMASAVANFSISGNDPAYYPDTPFQIIYRRPGNSFTVKPGTFLYLKFFFIDDAAPIFGDWPADKSGVEDYIFGGDQLGGHDLEVEVDGKVTSLNSPGYVGGPVATPESPDGSEHILQIGCFISPLNKGVHTVIIRGVFDGTAFVDNVGGPFAAEIIYTVTVE